MILSHMASENFQLSSVAQSCHKYMTFKYMIYLNLIDTNVFYITGARVRKFLDNLILK